MNEEVNTIRNDIWQSGCPCGVWETENVVCFVSCRKSNGAVEYPGDVVEYKVKKNRKKALEELEDLKIDIGEDRTIDFVEIVKLPK